MRRAIELPDVHDVALVFQDSGLVIIDIKVVGGGEDGHDGRKAGRFCLAVHAIPEKVIRKGVLEWYSIQHTQRLGPHALE